MPFDPLTRKFIQTEAVGRPTMASLLARYGSFRRLMQSYWMADLDGAEEQVIEDSTPKADLIGYKPVAAGRGAELLREMEQLGYRGEDLVNTLNDLVITHVVGEHTTCPCGLNHSGPALGRPKSPYFNDGLD